MFLIIKPYELSEKTQPTQKVYDVTGSATRPSTFVAQSCGSVRSPCSARNVGHRFAENAHWPFYGLLSQFGEPKPRSLERGFYSRKYLKYSFVIFYTW